MHFLGFEEEKDEQVIPKLKRFLVNSLNIGDPIVNAMLIRDAHRMGAFKQNSKYPRPIIAGFVTMADRDLIYGNAYMLKGTKFAIRVDLPPELIPTRMEHVGIKKEILKVNPNALASCTYRSYKPVLIVKFKNKIQQFDAKTMKYSDLQPGDKVRPDQQD